MVASGVTVYAGGIPLCDAHVGHTIAKREAISSGNDYIVSAFDIFQKCKMGVSVG